MIQSIAAENFASNSARIQDYEQVVSQMSKIWLKSFKLVERVSDALGYSPRKTNHEDIQIIRRIVPYSWNNEAQNYNTR